MCTYVDTLLSLPSLKYTVVAWLLTCLHLSTSGDPSSTKYDHLLSALPTDICSSINDSLAEIDENAADVYEQLKALLMSRYTMDRWARAFELHKFPEIGDMKPSGLPADMIDHIISQDFKERNKMAEYADKLYARRRGNAVAAVNANHDSAINAVSGGRRRESSPHDRRRRSPSRQGSSRRKTPGPYRDDSDICYYHITYGEQARKCKPGCQWVPGNGSAAEN